jgi:DNA gyrase subunit A
VFFGVADPTRDGVVVTSSGSSGALPGTEGGSLKVTPYAEYPAKGRATGGVRCHRFLRGEDTLVLAFAGNEPARAAAANGVAIELPPADGRRDGSGAPTTTVIAHVAGPPADWAPSAHAALTGSDDGAQPGDDSPEGGSA